MDEIAEMGIAAHWKYKGIRQQQGIDDWLSDLRTLLEQAEDPNEMAESLKQLDSYQKEIFVFTPNGDLKKIPAGSSILDFAFEVHSKLGVLCVGAKVNGKLASIKDTLKNGDQVEVITSKNQKPTKDWLSFVITSKARSKIKQSLKEEELKVANIGKELLTRRLKNWKLEFSDEAASQFIKKNKIRSITEFYAMLANGKIDVAVIKSYIENASQTEEKSSAPEVQSFQYSREQESGDFLIIDEHLANVDYKLATCCNPIFGDDIFGFVTISHGIKIHRSTCPNAKSMLERYSYRVVKAKWQQTRESNSFQTTIRIIGEDQMGLLTRISEVLSKEMKVNLRSATFDTKKGLFEGKIKVYVENIKQLDMIIHRINRIKGVIKASRVATSD
jgi:GTP pyrophosphokinase